MLQLNGAILMHCLAAYFPIALYVNKCRNEHKGIQILGIQGKMNTGGQIYQTFDSDKVRLKIGQK